MKDAEVKDLNGRVALITLILISLAGLQGCNSETSSRIFRTNGGAQFLVNGGLDYFTPELMSDIELDIVSRVHDNLNWPASTSWMLISLAEVNVVSSPFKCVYGECDGVESGENIMIADDPDGCPWKGAYAHELAHLFSLAVTSDGDADHKNSILWQSVLDSNNSHKCN